MEKTRIGIIGAGNIGRCITSGLIHNHYPPHCIWVTNPTPEKLTFFKKQFNIQTTRHNREAVEQVDLILLAVKPEVIPQIANEISGLVKKSQKLVASVAAGLIQCFLLNG